MKKYLYPLIISAVFLLFQLITLPDYGINWDAPFRMLRGQAYLELFLTGKTTFRHLPDRLSPLIFSPGDRLTRFDGLDGEGQNTPKLPDRILTRTDSHDSLYKNNIFSADYFLRQDGGHPPFPDLLAAVSNRIFFEKLHLFSDTQSYQLPYLLIAALGVFFVAAFAQDLSASPFIGSVAGSLFALLPVFFAESHFNMKDPLMTSFMAGAVWSFWHWMRSNRTRWLVIFTTLSAFAFATKWNALYLIFILLPWLFWLKKFSLKIIFKLLLSGLVILGFFFLIWPFTWSHPLAKLFSSAGYYSNFIGTGTEVIQPPGFILPFGFNLYPAFLLLVQTPLPVICLFLFSLILLLLRKYSLPDKSGFLLLLWFLFPIFRISLPGSTFYSGLRLIMEVFAPLAILSALSFKFLLSKFPKFYSYILFVFVICHLSFVIYSYHPLENLYYNFFAGGPAGALKQGYLTAKSTYGSIYREVADWLNHNATPSANLAFLDGSLYALPPQWLRPDISLSPFHFTGFDQKGEYIISIPTAPEPTHFAYQYPQRFLKPIHLISVANTPVISIYKNSPQYLKTGFDQQISSTDFVRTDFPDHLEIDLKSGRRLTQLLVINPRSMCQKTSLGFSDELIVLDHQNINFPEKTYLGNNIIRYSFAADSTAKIRIYPANPLSCFNVSKILSISYLSPTE
jgi:4-amino-4-deoxy-L-arabinose transferase-like glycosyltransferase